MAYDSATDTALASQAYQRALASAAQRRDSLNTQFGLRGDPGHEGELNNTPAGNLGSIYQTGLAGEQQYERAVSADRSRGFRGSGGLAGRAQAHARTGAINSQAIALQGAAQQLGGVTQEEQAAKQNYVSEVGAGANPDGTGGVGGNIGKRSAFDLAQTLAANPVYGDAPTPGAPPPAFAQAGAAIPQLQYKQLFKSNPTKFSTIKGKF